MYIRVLFVRNHVLIRSAHWRHLADTIERSAVQEMGDGACTDATVPIGLSAADAVDCGIKFSP